MLKSLGLWKNKGSTVGSAETFPKSSHDSKSTEETSLKREDTISLKQQEKDKDHQHQQNQEKGNGNGVAAIEAGNDSDQQTADNSTQEQEGLICAQVWEQWQVYESFQYGPQFLKLW